MEIFEDETVTEPEVNQDFDFEGFNEATRMVEMLADLVGEDALAARLGISEEIIEQVKNASKIVMADDSSVQMLEATETEGEWYSSAAGAVVKVPALALAFGIKAGTLKAIE